MTAKDREESCIKLGADKRRVDLPLDDVRRIDALLAGKWGITIPLPIEQWVDRLSELAGDGFAA